MTTHSQPHACSPGPRSMSTLSQWFWCGMAACGAVSLAGYAAGRWLDRQTAREWARRWN